MLCSANTSWIICATLSKTLCSALIISLLCSITVTLLTLSISLLYYFLEGKVWNSILGFHFKMRVGISSLYGMASSTLHLGKHHQNTNSNETCLKRNLAAWFFTLVKLQAPKRAEIVFRRHLFIVKWPAAARACLWNTEEVGSSSILPALPFSLRHPFFAGCICFDKNILLIMKKICSYADKCIKKFWILFGS